MAWTQRRIDATCMGIDLIADSHEVLDSCLLYVDTHSIVHVHVHPAMVCLYVSSDSIAVFT